MTSSISEYYADTDETMVGDSVCSRLDEHYKANNITLFSVWNHQTMMKLWLSSSERRQ